MEPQNVSFIDTSQTGSERASQERDRYSQDRDRLSQDRDRHSQDRERPTSLSQHRSSVRSNRMRGADNNGSEDESPTSERLKRMSIGSGSRTYRITGDGSSPTRPTVGTKTFRVPTKRGQPVHDDSDLPQPSMHQRSLSPLYQPERDDTTSNDELMADIKTEPLNECVKPEKGFYISFDGDVPTKPKPLLRPKKFTRKSSQPATPMPTPSNEDFSVVSVSGQLLCALCCMLKLPYFLNQSYAACTLFLFANFDSYYKIFS